MLPASLEKTVGDPPRTLARIVTSHEVNWSNACKGVGQATTPFEYAAKLTEVMLLGVVAMKVMAGGNRRADAKTKDILKRDGAMLAALKWTLRNPFVHTTIPSITDMEQLDENLRAMAAPFSEADGKVLAARLREIGPEYCRMCGACSGQCRYGLEVADINRFLMYSENYGEFGLGREHFQMLPAAAKEVRCASCERCTVTCPNGVRVAERLSRAQECFA